ncbi:MAG: hypothetical protein QM669_07660 [Siphonobacter sp.]
MTPSTTAWTYFQKNVRKGFGYALWFVILGGLSGALYGLLAGILIQPAVFTILFCGTLAVLNFIVALVIFLIGLCIAIFRKISPSIIRYFALSLSFALTYLSIYGLLYITGIQVF